ncbi:unnamed protein product [Protopolystoma xenopodis]|uniref:Uncharacterized protein n=1 Tax=Protopolystoma xenopodis TaxID=117903 RepID=A0A3S5B4G0_9PLAT|nr:unnamed protein product [Protopolystoma xenopodis]
MNSGLGGYDGNVHMRSVECFQPVFGWRATERIAVSVSACSTGPVATTTTTFGLNSPTPDSPTSLDSTSDTAMVISWRRSCCPAIVTSNTSAAPETLSGPVTTPTDCVTSIQPYSLGPSGIDIIGLPPVPTKPILSERKDTKSRTNAPTVLSAFNIANNSIAAATTTTTASQINAWSDGVHSVQTNQLYDDHRRRGKNGNLPYFQSLCPNPPESGEKTTERECSSISDTSSCAIDSMQLPENQLGSSFSYGQALPDVQSILRSAPEDISAMKHAEQTRFCPPHQASLLPVPFVASPVPSKSLNFVALPFSLDQFSTNMLSAQANGTNSSLHGATCTLLIQQNRIVEAQLSDVINHACNDKEDSNIFGPFIHPVIQATCKTWEAAS